VKPGHMFPLRARAGGVLARTGQTEASVDLARLAGLHPSGVICEIMKDDGTMARVPDLVDYCQTHNLLMVTVADLAAYRLRRDPIIRPCGVEPMATTWGQIMVHRFESALDGAIHLAFVFGDLAGPPPLVRVHVERLPDDLLGFAPATSTPFNTAMQALAQEGRGVLVYLRRQAPETEAVAPSDREVGVGAQILGHLGVRQMRLLSRQEKKYIGLRGFDLDLVATVHLEAL
ncbi:MAG: 3,4-dihydroxy-2-butanone-4-phosphate synthase, partial [Holophaga sp.]|nr:3,4-dihydroxy-2-butanone-4-phosphate synthase [Holophaga sp.]